MGSAVISGIWILSRGKHRTEHGGPGCGSLYLNRLRTVTMGRALCRAGAGTVLLAGAGTVCAGAGTVCAIIRGTRRAAA